jgi:hypothetical protein
VYRAIIYVALKRQHAGSAISIGIILDRFGGQSASDDVVGKNIIHAEFIKAMVGDADIAAKHKHLHAT